ncbi:hypothetical protein HELRODRAFT_124980, partial [Helobdella robusta]|uniref:NEDD4-binding protein 2-like 1 n=1 Tax=Helobdella robusta TaxID=6412 RepID=T1EH37_HELRO
KVLVLMRGCPGSGKSTLAKAIQFNGVVLSTDDFFMRGGDFKFVANQLQEAHEWNQSNAEKYMLDSRSPIIIDNTNTQMWEMIPYAAMADKYGYIIEVIEPDVPWRKNAGQLVRSNMHGVRMENITSMLDRYENNITSQKLL